MEEQLYCTIDREPIPPERQARNAVTCSEECKKKLKRIRRERVKGRKCKQCGHPSSQEERKAFLQWRRSLPGNEPKKRGPKSKAAAEVSAT